MRTCKKCQQSYQHGSTALFEPFCAECWITEYKVEPEAAAEIRAGAFIHTTNCNACRRVNRIYCPKCVD